MKKSIILKQILVMVIAFIPSLIVAQDKNNEDVSTVKLIQTPGKFENGELKLKAGNYQFEVVNKNIDTEVAFILRKEEDRESMDLSTALPNSLLKNTLKKGEKGMTGVVKLESGQYVYGCPLNETPIYTITVE